ncbi:MAG: hypothetical protein AAF050_25770, partial [Cyanobacteria bacterium J06649_5]
PSKALSSKKLRLASFDVGTDDLRWWAPELLERPGNSLLKRAFDSHSLHTSLHAPLHTIVWGKSFLVATVYLLSDIDQKCSHYRCQDALTP